MKETEGPSGFYYQGNQFGLQHAPLFDETRYGTGYVIRTQGTQLPAWFDGMLRLGGNLSDVNLETPANQKLGAMQHVILDLHAGQALYAVLNVGGFLGVGQKAVAVPWTMFQIDNTDKTTTQPIVRLNVTQTNLKSAPTIDDSQLSLWPKAAQPNWDNQYKQFWKTVAG